MRHECVANEVNTYRQLAKKDADEALVRKITNLEEFKRPLMKNNRAWRLYCGIMRREAYKRGLGIL